jgi:hypothetical protein
MKKRTIPLPFGDSPILDFEANASNIEVVRVKSGEAPCLEVDGSTEPEVRLDNEVVVVRPNTKSFLSGWDLSSASTVLRVPAHLKARFRMDMSRAVIRDLAGCDLEVSTQAGSLELHEVRGRLKLKASAGQIRGEGLAGTFWVDCGAGSARLGIVGLDPGEHQVHSNMGSVRIELAPGLDVRIDARTVMGSTRTQYPSNSKAAAVLKLEAELGSVRISEGKGDEDPRHGDWPDWRKLWAAAEAFVTAPAVAAARATQPTPSSEELRQILVMVEAGKINAAEAERLIRAISGE